MRRMIPQNKIEVLNHFENNSEGDLSIFSNSSIYTYVGEELSASFFDDGVYVSHLDTPSITGQDEGITIDPDPNQADCYLIINNLPTSDPKVAGAIWNDNGVLKISSGE